LATYTRDAFEDTCRWRTGVEATFSEMANRTGIKKLRVRGRRAVGLSARLKAIGVNLLRAARVKSAREGFYPENGSPIYTVKEQFLGR